MYISHLYYIYSWFICCTVYSINTCIYIYVCTVICVMQSMYWHVWFKKNISSFYLLEFCPGIWTAWTMKMPRRLAKEPFIHCFGCSKMDSPSKVHEYFRYVARVFTGNACRFTSPIYACRSKWLATQIKQQKQNAWNAKLGVFGTLSSQIHLSNSHVVGREPFGATAGVLYVRRSLDMMYGCSYPKGSIV